MPCRFIASLMLLLLSFGPTARAALLVKSGQKIVFMGDSITEIGWGQQGGWVRLVVAGMGSMGANITPIPSGVPGQTSREMVARVKPDVLDKKPDWLVLSCGVNDVWHGPEPSGVNLDHYKQNITSIVDQALAAGIKVMIMTSTGIGEDLPNGNNVALIQYNDFLKQLAKDRNLPVADENAVFRAAITAAHAPAGTNVVTIDGVHPIVPGHLLMARTLMAAFGASADDLAKLDQFWQDMPAGATVSAEMFIRGAGLISLRQYAVFKAAAEQQKLTVDELALKIYYEVMVQEVNAHAADPKPVSGMQYNNEFQKIYQARIDALCKS
jgi:lysophospholipase L1-like esterase